MAKKNQMCPPGAASASQLSARQARVRTWPLAVGWFGWRRSGQRIDVVVPLLCRANLVMALLDARKLNMYIRQSRQDQTRQGARQMISWLDAAFCCSRHPSLLGGRFLESLHKALRTPPEMILLDWCVLQLAGLFLTQTGPRGLNSTCSHQLQRCQLVTSSQGLSITFKRTSCYRLLPWLHTEYPYTDSYSATKYFVLDLFTSFARFKAPGLSGAQRHTQMAGGSASVVPSIRTQMFNVLYSPCASLNVYKTNMVSDALYHQ